MPVSILVSLPHNLGDVIMGLPVARALKERYTGCRLTWLVEPGYEGGLEGAGYCDEIICFDRQAVRDDLRSGRWDRGLRRLTAFAADLNARGFDRILNFSQNRYISHVLSLVNNAEFSGQRFRREGVHAISDPWSQYLYAIPYARRYNDLHATDIYRRIALVAHCGAGRNRLITPDDSEKKEALAYLCQKGFDSANRRTIIFQPGAAFPSKRWPLDNFAALGRMLIDRGWQVIITGAPAEAGVAARLRHLLGDRCIATAGETSFRQAIALLCVARGCVTGDTAMMHAAAASGVCVYALFGPTSPVETGPWSEGNWIFAGRCPSRPCFCSRCKSMLCTKSILPETVYSCIVHKNPGVGVKCDVFRTGYSDAGDFTLLPVNGSLNAYIDRPGAAIVRQAFEPVSQPLYHREERVIALEETGQFCRALQSLELLLRDGSKEAIVTFEKQRAGLSGFRGVGQFFSALLNIGLNSIPMIDPHRAVSLSIDTCAGLRTRVESVISAYDTNEL